MVEFLAVTCGGTGGHFFPGLSVAREQIARGGRAILLLSGKNSVEQSKIAANYQVPAVVLPYMPSPSPRYPGSIWRFLKGLTGGIAAAKKVLRKERPQALLGMGSFASLPAIYAAHRLGIPIVLHDGNARIGKANRMLSRWAKALGTAFPAVNGETAKCPLEVTGMPVRPELAATRLTKAEAIAGLNAKFGGKLEADRFTILLFGGSQGARKLNESVGGAFRKLTGSGKKWQLIHLTGKGEFDAMQKFWLDAPAPVLALASLAEMTLAYEAADLVVSRSGGSSVAEINAFGKYAVVIPYPYAAEGHQKDNADYLATLGAAEVIDNAAMTPEKAEAVLTRLAGQPELAELAAKSVRPEAWDGGTRVLAMIDRVAQ